MRVASFTDAWIETYITRDFELIKVSHLLQMRGLKLVLQWRRACKGGVASFTDAWIETYLCKAGYIERIVASFTDAWIETLGF